MKRFVACWAICLSVTVSAADLAAVQEAEKQLKEAELELSTVKDKNSGLQRTLQTLENTIMITEDPQKRLEILEKDLQAYMEDKLVYSARLDDLRGYKIKGNAKIADCMGEQVLCVTCDDDQSHYISRYIKDIPEGTTIVCRVKMKGEDVTLFPGLKKGRGGTRFGLMVNVPNDKRMWPGATPSLITFDWVEAEFSYRVPHGPSGVLVIIGITGATGTVWYKDLSITAKVVKPE